VKNIGLIGVGLMGHGIASNLLKHGHPLTVLVHPGNQALDALQAQGVKTASSLEALTKSSQIIILCVTGTPQVEEVLLSPNGVLANLVPGTIIIDCSTAVPSSTERIASLVQAAGGLFLDSPMTRTPKEAAEGRLNLLVGGDTQLFTECKPLLACFAENIVHAGPVGAGHRMKLLHNYVSLGSITLIAEAAACAKVAGINPETFVEVLTKGGGGGAALERLKPFILAGDASGLRFSLANALKDLSYYNNMAQDSLADCTIAAAVKQTIASACEQGDASVLLPEIVNRIAARKGQA
jgi:3-hydroxyisobutyrate dehydrogenase-like beta-hydroxyacid dehydrogenase